MKNLILSLIICSTSCNDKYDVGVLTRKVAEINVNLEYIEEIYGQAIDEIKTGKQPEDIKNKFQPQVLKLRKQVMDSIEGFNKYCESNSVPEELYNSLMNKIDSEDITEKANELMELGISFDLEKYNEY